MLEALLTKNRGCEKRERKKKKKQLSQVFKANGPFPYSLLRNAFLLIKFTSNCSKETLKKHLTDVSQSFSRRKWLLGCLKYFLLILRSFKCCRWQGSSSGRNWTILDTVVKLLRGNKIEDYQPISHEKSTGDRDFA